MQKQLVTSTPRRKQPGLAESLTDNSYKVVDSQIDASHEFKGRKSLSFAKTSNAFQIVEYYPNHKNDSEFVIR